MVAERLCPKLAPLLALSTPRRVEYQTRQNTGGIQMLMKTGRPFSRAVTGLGASLPNGGTEMILECGHRTKRRFYLCAPKRVLCRECAEGC